MDFLLLLQTFHYLRNLVRYLLYALGISVKGVDGLLVMTHLVLPLLKLFSARITMALLSQVLNLLLKDVCSLLEVHDL